MFKVNDFFLIGSSKRSFKCALLHYAIKLTPLPIADLSKSNEEFQIISLVMEKIDYTEYN